MLRIFLFLLTNIAVLAVAGTVLSLLGVESYLTPYGLNMQSLIIWGAAFGFGGSLVSLALSKWMAKRLTGTRIIASPANEQERWLLETVRELSQKAGIGMPEVGIMPMDAANAFATGARRDSALVAASEGLLKRFSRDEARAVMAHEIGHIANGDMITLTLIQGVLNTFVFVLSRVIGNIIDRAVFRNTQGRGIGFWITTIIAQILLSIIASMIVMWFSRRREYRADAYSGDLVGTAAMVGALQRLQNEQRGEREARTAADSADLPDEMRALGIRGRRSLATAMFSSHPPLEARIQALQTPRFQQRPGKKVQGHKQPPQRNPWVR